MVTNTASSALFFGLSSICETSVNIIPVFVLIECSIRLRQMSKSKFLAADCADEADGPQSLPFASAHPPHPRNPRLLSLTKNFAKPKLLRMRIHFRTNLFRILGLFLLSRFVSPVSAQVDFSGEWFSIPYEDPQDRRGEDVLQIKIA
jgi:hypothetical protein